MSLNISVTDTDEFPSLGKKTVGTQTRRKRSSSALSSQSSTSAGYNCPPVKKSVRTAIPKGDYYTSERAVLRPFLNCRCQNCEDYGRGTWLRERQWTMSCEKAWPVVSGTAVRVLQSKVVHHKVEVKTSRGTSFQPKKFRNERFSVAQIELEDSNDYFGISGTDYDGYDIHVTEGWVMSKTLKVRGGIRSASRVSDSGSTYLATSNVQRENVVDRSRSVSVATSVPESVFCNGEPVKVLNMAGDWVDAVVKSENPLMVRMEGDDTTIYPAHLEFVRKYPARKWRLTCNAKVRSTEHVDKWDQIATLKKGTMVSITHMSGYEGRITSPVCGWITMRNKHSLNVVEPDWKFVEQKPTIIVKNLPSNITEAKLIRELRLKAYCDPESIEFEEKGGKYRAIIEVGYRTGCKLVNQKTMEIWCGWNVSFQWSMDFLRNNAAKNLYN